MVMLGLTEKSHNIQILGRTYVHTNIFPIVMYPPFFETSGIKIMMGNIVNP